MVFFKNSIREVGVIAATTVGAGMFALPYIFKEAGQGIGIFYLAVFSAIVPLIHILYWDVLKNTKGEIGLLGLSRTYFGQIGYVVGFIAIVAGLTLALVVYLILGAEFIRILSPRVSVAASFVSFWVISALPVLFKEKRILVLEILGIIFMGAVISLIFFGSDLSRGLKFAPGFSVHNFFLPFGTILFSLAGWTAIEPLFKSREDGAAKTPVVPIIFGTVVAAALYWMFVVGVFGSAAEITPDTISGLRNWPFWKSSALAFLGLFALWTSYLPIAAEIKNELTHDLGWSGRWSLVFVILAPLTLVLLGFKNFLRVLGLAGGVFLGLQYLLIVLIGKKVLRPAGLQSFILNLLALVFAAAAVYEIYYFVIG